MSQNGCTFNPRDSGCTRVFEQRAGSRRITGAVVQIGREEQAPAGIVRARGRREPKRLLGEIGGRNRGPARVRRPSSLLESRRDVSIGLGSGEREMAGSFLGGGDDVGEPCVQRPAACGCLADDDRRAQQRVRESHVFAVEVEDPRVERLGEPRIACELRAPLPGA